MKKFIKSFIATVFLTICIFTVTSCSLNKSSMSDRVDINRSIETNEVNYNTYFSDFDDYSIEKTDESIEINLSEIINVSDYEINHVSVSESEQIYTDFKVRFDAKTNKVYLDCTIQVGDEMSSIETIEGLLVTLENGTIDTVFEIDNEIVLLSDLNLDMEINQCGWFSNLVKKVTKGIAQACTTVAVSLAKAAPYVAAVAVTAAVGASAVITGGGSLMLAPVAYSAVAAFGVYVASTVGLAANGAIYNAISDAIPESTNSSSNNSADDIEDVDKESLSENVQDAYDAYEDIDWDGEIYTDSDSKANANTEYKNRDGKLPQKDSNGNNITYKEYDVNDCKVGNNRDAERFVKGSDGSIYYTDDHYGTFVRVK